MVMVVLTEITVCLKCHGKDTFRREVTCRLISILEKKYLRVAYFDAFARACQRTRCGCDVSRDAT